uniref:Uncharacterized protein n=1 Tax=Dromaius novaehollandiae TaxID=8790 RepID=A0A8C4P654_DRONO
PGLHFMKVHGLKNSGSSPSPLTAAKDGILTSSHESQMLLMASKMVNPFQNVFNLLCPDPSEEPLPMAAINGSCVSRHENNINLVVYLHQSSWVTRCIVNEQQYFERNLFFLSSRSQQWA